MGKLDNQTAWITGGGTGIGALAASALAQAGAEVFVSGRRLESIKAVVQPISNAGGKVHAVPLGVVEWPGLARLGVKYDRTLTSP